MKCGQYNLRKGTKVIIASADQKKILGEGTYAGFKRMELFGPCNMPKFRLGRRIIYGYECWWIPKSETKQKTPPDDYGAGRKK